MDDDEVLAWSDAWSDADIRHYYLWMRDSLLVYKRIKAGLKERQARYAIMRAIMRRRGISTKYWSRGWNKDNVKTQEEQSKAK